MKWPLELLLVFAVLLLWILAHLADAATYPVSFCLTPLNRVGNSEANHLHDYPPVNLALRTEWCAIEPALDQYDWSYLDEGIAIASSNGHKASIAVVTLESPQWLFDAGAQPFGTHSYPAPWDPVFLKHWSKLIRHLAQRYDGNTALAYVTVGGPGYLEEGYLSHCSSDQEYYDSGAWLKASSKIVRCYRNWFRTTPVYLAFGTHPVPGYGSDMQLLADYARSLGLGLKLNTLSQFQPASGDMQYDEITSSELPACLQFVAPAKSLESFAGAIDRAQGLKAAYVEYYYCDRAFTQ